MTINKGILTRPSFAFALKDHFRRILLMEQGFMLSRVITKGKKDFLFLSLLAKSTWNWKGQRLRNTLLSRESIWIDRPHAKTKTRRVQGVVCNKPWVNESLDEICQAFVRNGINSTDDAFTLLLKRRFHAAAQGLHEEEQCTLDYLINQDKGE